MIAKAKRLRQCVIGTVALSLLSASAALAGPPLICHSIAIGEAQSLPWTSQGLNQGSEKKDYDLKNLVPDTLAILNPSTPVLVRMETLRRATLYVQKSPQAAKELLARLQARAVTAQDQGHPDALALFDFGYLVETYGQRAWFDKSSQNPAAGIDGYASVKKAIELRGADPQMEFAAALITLTVAKDAHRGHVAKANAGAQKDSLLAENLASRSMGGST